MARQRMLRLLTLPVLCTATTLLGCGDDTSSMPDDDANSGFTGTDSSPGTDSGPGSGPGSNSDSDSDSDSDTDGPDPGTDDGEPGGPGDGEELCDAGDEAWVKRTIPFIQGRRPASIREVRLLTSMIAQIDGLGEHNGRRVVARGLARGDQYLERWKTYLYEELQVNVNGDRRNDLCYDLDGGQGDGPELAAFIRDNPPTADYGSMFWMPDVVYSGLLLDDLSPIYRADLFASMSAPIIAGNVTPVELEEMRRTNFGMTFEEVFLGRTTECNQCHITQDSVTDSAVEELDRHWPIPGHFESSVYGPQVQEGSDTRSHAVFRFFNFAVGQDTLIGGGMPAGYASAWGFGPSCGGFRLATPGLPPVDLRSAEYQPYMVSDYTAEYPPNGIGATLADLDQELRSGFDALRGNPVDVAGDGSVDPQIAAAYLFSMNMADQVWTEALGHPLTVANNFPRNAAQRDTLQHLADTFKNESYSLRALVTEIATNDYYNQSPPAECGATTPYHMAAVFDPFTRSAEDPAARGNGVGDSIHRMGAWPLLDSIAQAMWWNKPDRFGPDQGQTPELNCGGDMPQIPCVEEPEDVSVLRDLGAFLSDSEGGFEGVDLVALLRLEDAYGQGVDPGQHGVCTGPLGQACATNDWITQLIDVAVAQPEADMWDVASAVKDRVIAEPTIGGQAEQTVLEDLMGVSLTDPVGQVGAGAAEQAARRLAGMLFNTPQFLLVGVAPADQDPAEDPVLVVPGTSTQELCEYLAPLILDNTVDGYTYDYACSSDGIDITGVN